VSTCGEGVINQESDVGPPILESQSQDSGSDESDTTELEKTQKEMIVNSAAPVLSVMEVPDVDHVNALRSPPKLLPIVFGPKR